MAESSYGQFCPVAMAAEILGARWTLILLSELVVGSTRFNELRRGLPRMSPALLSKRLKELESAKVVSAGPGQGRAGHVRIPAHRSGTGAEAGDRSDRRMGSKMDRSRGFAAEPRCRTSCMWDMRRNIDPRADAAQSGASSRSFSTIFPPRAETGGWSSSRERTSTCAPSIRASRSIFISRPI